MILGLNDDWQPPHRILDAVQILNGPLIGGAENAPAPVVRRFSLAHHFLRGGYPGSLHAGSSMRALQWRERWLRDELPFLPLNQRDEPIDPKIFWPLLAESNGLGLGKLRTGLGLDDATFARAIATVEQRGLLYQLPFWSEPGVASAAAPLNYWRDSALVANLQRRRAFPSRVSGWDDRRWESFAIASLIGAAGIAVRPRVYRVGQDEIDLVIEWPHVRPPWAIEISTSRSKRLSAGNWRAFEDTQADRLIVVDAGRSGRPPRARGEEPMRLIEALREVREGP